MSPFFAEHQAEVVPTQGHFRSPLRGGLGELDRFFELVVFHQSRGQVEASAKGDAGVQWYVQGLAIEGHGLIWVGFG